MEAVCKSDSLRKCICPFSYHRRANSNILFWLRLPSLCYVISDERKNEFAEIRQLLFRCRRLKKYVIFRQESKTKNQKKIFCRTFKSLDIELFITNTSCGPGSISSLKTWFYSTYTLFLSIKLKQISRIRTLPSFLIALIHLKQIL